MDFYLFCLLVYATEAYLRCFLHSEDYEASEGYFLHLDRATRIDLLTSCLFDDCDPPSKYDILNVPECLGHSNGASQSLQLVSRQAQSLHFYR